MFETATRIKLRFESPKGLLSVEDLWDLPLTATSAAKANLNDIAKGVSRQLKDNGDEDFVDTNKKADAVLQLKLDIIKHIIAVRQTEKDTAQQAAAKREQKHRLLELIARKKDAEMEGKTVEELEAMVNQLS